MKGALKWKIIDRFALEIAVRSILHAKLGRDKRPVQEKPRFIDPEILKFHLRRAIADLKRSRGLIPLAVVIALALVSPVSAPLKQGGGDKQIRSIMLNGRACCCGLKPSRIF